MIRTNVAVEVVTPLFLGGSDPRGTPELRPASFRGAMRFWLRALIGQSIGDYALDDLRRKETEVFGDASQDSGSAVIARIAGQPKPSAFAPPGQSNPGLRYLLFSMGQRERDPRTGQTSTIWRECFAPNTKFDLILQMRTPASTDAHELIFRRAAASLWLSVWLGGLGARSRRGAGSLRIVGDPIGWPTDLPSPVMRANSPDQLRTELASGLRSLWKATGLSGQTQIRNPSAFDVLHPDVCNIRVLDKTWTTWQEALETIGAAFQGFRNRYQPDYGNVKDVIGGRSQRFNGAERAAFGLPIVFYFRSLGGSGGTLEGREHDRRASPMWIKITRLANGHYTVILTMFHATLLEQNEGLKLTPRRARPAFAAAPGLELIDDFFDALSTKGSAHYVAPLMEVNYR